MTTGQKRRLRRYVCGWCDQRIDRKSCGAIYERCSPEVMQKRRDDCLAEYRPRNPADKPAGAAP